MLDLREWDADSTFIQTLAAPPPSITLQFRVKSRPRPGYFPFFITSSSTSSTSRMIPASKSLSKLPISVVIFDFVALWQAREKQLKKEKFLLKQAERQEQEQRSFHASKKNKRKNAKHGAEDENSEDYVDPETPSGDKKHMSCQIAKQYSPSAVEKSFFLHQM